MAADVPKGDRLPPDWNYSVTRDGRVFFINERSQTTTWLHPLNGRPVQTGNSPAQDLPPGWEQAVTLDGSLYFLDHNSGTTTFDHPLSARPSLYDTTSRSPPHSPQAPLSPTDRNSKKFLAKQRSIKAPSAKRNPASTVMRKGWLYRFESGAIGKTWKKRWCVIADFALFVYKDGDETSVVTSVLLPSYRINIMTTADQVYRDYGFKLEHENTKTLYFATDNQGDLDRWLALLTQAAMMKGQQGFVRETNNNRVGGPRHRSHSRGEEDETDYPPNPELQRSWKDPGSYRKMHREEDMEPPDPRDFSQEYPAPHEGGPYDDRRRDDGHYQEHHDPRDPRSGYPPSNRSSHAGSMVENPSNRNSRDFRSHPDDFGPEDGHHPDRLGDAHDRNSMSRNSDRNSMSRPYQQDSLSRPHMKDNNSRPYERDSFSRPHERDSLSQPHERDSLSRPYERDSLSRPYERDSLSRPHERDSLSRPHERDSLSRPYERESLSRPHERDSYARQSDRNSMSRMNDRNSMSRMNDRNSMSRMSDRNSMSRMSDRNSMSRMSDRNSLSRASDPNMMRPHDRNSMSTVSRASVDGRYNVNDPYNRENMERNRMTEERDRSLSQNRGSMSDPRHSFTDPRGSYSRADLQEHHLEGEDPYARIRDMQRSGSHGFNPYDQRDSQGLPESYGQETDPRFGHPQEPDQRRYGSRDQEDPHSGDHYGQDSRDVDPRVVDPRLVDPRGNPAESWGYQGTPNERDTQRDSYSRGPYSQDRYPAEDEDPGFREQRIPQDDVVLGSHGALYPDENYQPTEHRQIQSGNNGPQRDRLSRASEFSGMGSNHGDRASRASDYPEHDGHHGDRSSRASDYPNANGYQGERSSRAMDQPPSDDRDGSFQRSDMPGLRPSSSGSNLAGPHDMRYGGYPTEGSPHGSDSPRRHQSLTVNIPPTYVNLSADPQGQGNEESPGRPPYPTQIRKEMARELAQTKTPRTSHDLVVSVENEARRRQEAPFFQYPSPRNGEPAQQRDPREVIQEGRERDSVGQGSDEQQLSMSNRYEIPVGYGRIEPQKQTRDVDRGEGRPQSGGGAQELRSAYERVQQLRQSQRDLTAARKSLDTIQPPVQLKDTKREDPIYSDTETRVPSPIVYSPGGSYVKNLDEPEDLYERGSAFRPPSSCTSSIKGDNSTLERKPTENSPFQASNDLRSHFYQSPVDTGQREAEDHDGNYIQMTREIAREIGKSYIQDKWTGPREETYARPQKKKLPRAMSTVKEDPNMSDGDVLTTREIKNLNKKYPINGSRVRMSISAGDLIGKTHDELVLLLIQLRRNQSALEKAKDFYRQRLQERRLSEREYKRQRSNSEGELDHEVEQDHQMYKDYKTQLEELENKLEVYKPLINLVDNMVTMGSLYGGDNYMLATQYRKHLLRPDQYTEPRDMLLFSRQHQEKKFVQEIEQEIKQLSAEEVDLEEKLERLYELDRNLQEQSFKVVSFREDKELLEKALQGIIRQQDHWRNDPREMSKLVHQQLTIEKELSLIMQQLAEASQELEETTAENNKLEHEVALLRTKVNGELSRSRSAVSLGGGDTEKTKQQMEKELAKVNNIMAGLSAERGRLSQAMNTLRRSSSGTQLAALMDKDSEPTRKKNTSYMITDLDTMESIDMSGSKSPRSPHQLTPRSKSMGDLRMMSPGTPGADQGKAVESLGRPMMTMSYAEGLNQPVSRFPVISHQRQQSSLATSTDATDNMVDPDDPNATWDISEADDNTKRFFGIIPRERPKVLTVRDVKRQSEQRKEREKMRREDEGSTGWYSVSSSQQLPTDSDSELPNHVRYPSDISSSYASEISHIDRAADPGPVYENLPHADHLARTASVPVLTNFNSNPSSRRSSIGLFAPKPFIPYQDKTSSASGIFTARPFFSEMDLSSEQGPPDGNRDMVQTSNSAFSTPVVFRPNGARSAQASRVYAPKPWAREGSAGIFNVKKSPKGRYMTISSSEPYKRETSSLLGNTLHSSAGDLIMNRSIDNVPDIVKSSTQKVDTEPFDEYTIEREILFRPDKVDIPERYVPDSDEEDLTDAQRIERIEKAEKIKRILANQSVHSLSQPDISHIGQNIHRKVEIEKQRRSQLLALGQDLAKQVTLKTKQDAAHRRKTWSGGQFAEAFPHGVESGIHDTLPTTYTQQRSNVLV
ncbi:uncharacterized protein LOC124118799 isoform X2 [Haliotis rufescens]|uniref:uncharacterized protein LOC124118799 isoform X2 n=1 Tax=Haliotis rufescens TaxID=6454 RepID=UPI00201F31D0|nr:uncharacterized protein LOC124118799 isoform X2 [Haliotis rufescens]